MTDTTSTTQADALREAAKFIAAHPDLPPAYVVHYGGGANRAELNYYLHINDRGGLAEQKTTAAAIVRAVKGTWKKEPWTGDNFRFTTQVGRLGFDVQVKRDAVCERVVVGTETVTFPATDLQVIAAQPERVETREVIEWVCAPILADNNESVTP